MLLSLGAIALHSMEVLVMCVATDDEVVDAVIMTSQGDAMLWTSTHDIMCVTTHSVCHVPHHVSKYVC